MTYDQAVEAVAKGEFVPAITTFLGHLSHDPTDGAAWLYLGIAYSESGHQDEALKALSHADALLQPNAELSEAFGCAYLRKGDVSAARPYFEDALQFDDCPGSVYRNLSVLLLKAEDLDAAMETLRIGLARTPNDILMLFTKVLVLEAHRQNDAEGAVRDQLQAVLEDILHRPGVPTQLAHIAEQHLATLR